jgi:hypothetical protein
MKFWVLPTIQRPLDRTDRLSVPVEFLGPQALCAVCLALATLLTALDRGERGQDVLKQEHDTGLVASRNIDDVSLVVSAPQFCLDLADMGVESSDAFGELQLAPNILEVLHSCLAGLQALADHYRIGARCDDEPALEQDLNTENRRQ